MIVGIDKILVVGEQSTVGGPCGDIRLGHFKKHKL